MPIEKTMGLTGHGKFEELLRGIERVADECLSHEYKVTYLLTGANSLGQTPEYLPQALYANVVAALTAANSTQESKAVEGFKKQVAALAEAKGNDAALRACVDALAMSKDVKPFDVTEGGHAKIKHVAAAETSKLLTNILYVDVKGFSPEAAAKDPELYLHAATMLLDYNEKELDFFTRLTAVGLSLYQVEELAPIAFDVAPEKAKAAVDRCLEVAGDNKNELSKDFNMTNYVESMTAMQKRFNAPLATASHPGEKKAGVVEILKNDKMK